MIDLFSVLFANAMPSKFKILLNVSDVKMSKFNIDNHISTNSSMYDYIKDV